MPLVMRPMLRTNPEELPIGALTHVELLWIENCVETWIRFGHAAKEQIIDGSRRTVSFAPASIFAVVHWAANDYGTILSQIDILRAFAPGEPHAAAPDVQPGADILLRVSGWPKVEKVLHVIDAVEALGIDPAEAAPEHWRHVHNRLSVGEQPRSYTLSRHKAWLRRRRIAP
jgi:hypothetical protein